MILTNTRSSDPSESAAAYDPDQAHIILEAVAWLYTLGPASDEEIVWKYQAARGFGNRWPEADNESIRKRCSDARRLDKRLQKIGTTKSSHGKTVGVHAYTEVAAA